jgi:hypothetical protein
MNEDTIVAEIHQAREELAKRFNYDLKAIVEDARARQATSGHKVVSFPPRPVRTITGAAVRGTPSEAR